ncbi:hypothetical protein U0R10_00850 [Aquirufa sp. OSTEICH-129V]|jgi:uncharacterized protein (TIGR02145 family)|uniref:Fibrobacter succinogenes major paralogous domain-containing protein n=1 Tax=Aquirufa avitistagni TaxID=3104728 RepID=A0ABW6D8A7_9BACT
MNRILLVKNHQKIFKVNIKMLRINIIIHFFLIVFVGCKTEEPLNSTQNSSTIVIEVKSKTGRIWMDRNLGASQVARGSDDIQSYGDLYQWGRGSDGHQLRSSSTTIALSSSDIPNNGNFIITSGDWRSTQNDKLWQGVNGVNNPCPNGFRLPTKDEWIEEVSSWSSKDSKGALVSALRLPEATSRGSNGTYCISNCGIGGAYWLGTVGDNSQFSDPKYSYVGVFKVGVAGASVSIRGTGFSVRCIKD